MVAEADMGLTALALDEQQDMSGRYKGDDRLYVRFYIHPTHNPKKSADEGRPIFDDLEWVHIQVPGDRNNIVNRPASEGDRQRFADKYAKFKSSTVEITEGTALEHWPRITRAQVEELRFFGCRTVEQLAGMADAQVAKFPGVQTLKNWAKDFLEQAKEGAAASKLRAELEERDSKIGGLESAMLEMAKELKELKAAQEE